MNLNYPNLDALFGDTVAGGSHDIGNGRPDRSGNVLLGAAIPLGSWHYGTDFTGRHHWPWMGLFISVCFHLTLFYGFNARVARAPAATEPTVQLTLIDMSKLKPDVDADDDDLAPKPLVDAGMEAPTLPDLPSTVNLTDAFIQPIDFASLVPMPAVGNKNLLTIPPIVRHGTGNGGKGMSDLFNIGDLDRIPSALFRSSPQASPRILAEAAGNQVVIEFIVSKNGDVVGAQVIKEPSRELGEIALKSVMKWKFKPGMKGGRVVNTRVRQPIIFTAQKED